MPIRLRALVALLILVALAPSASALPYVCMETTQGEFCLEMLPEAAPGTVENFLHYVDEGLYANSLVHRSEPGFVLQGGGYNIIGNSLGEVPAGPAIANEFKLSNQRGTVAMARIGGQVHSATNQWFINLGNNSYLDGVDGGFTVFAEVVSGMEVVDRIAALAVFNLSNSLGSPFGRVPANAPADKTSLAISELVLVKRAYRAEAPPGVWHEPEPPGPGVEQLSPYQCSPASPGDTLTEFCGSTIRFPVFAHGQLVDATLNLVSTANGFVFALDRGSLGTLADTGQDRAIYGNDELLIPSVRVGARVLTNVRLVRSHPLRLEFKVEAYTPP